MGCICNLKREGEDMIILDINNDDKDQAIDEYLRQLSIGDKVSKRKSNKLKTGVGCMEDESSNKTSFALEPKKKLSVESFAEQMLKEINEVRTNPSGYAKKIRNYINNICTDDSDQHYFCVDLDAKISLPGGKKAFEECIEYLENIRPCGELILAEDLRLPFPSKNPEKAVSREYITSALLDKAKEVKDSYSINWFHYDNNINDAEVSIVLQIVDDNNSNGERRKHLLDQHIKYVGINIGLVRKNIYCIYLVFAS